MSETADRTPPADGWVEQATRREAELSRRRYRTVEESIELNNLEIALAVHWYAQRRRSWRSA